MAEDLSVRKVADQSEESLVLQIPQSIGVRFRWFMDAVY